VLAQLVNLTKTEASTGLMTRVAVG